MSPSAKLHLGSAAYALLLCSVNWTYQVKYLRQVGLTASSWTPAGLALVFSFTVMVVLLVRIVRQVRTALAAGTRIAPARWIDTWFVLVYLLPLLWRNTATSTSIDSDGTTMLVTRGYGHEGAPLVFLFAAASLLLFQVYTRLQPPSPRPPEAAGQAGPKLSPTPSLSS